MDSKPTAPSAPSRATSVLELIRARGMDSAPRELVPGKLHTFVNPHGYTLASRVDLPYERFDGLYVDGVLLRLALRAVGIRLPRLSFDMVGIAPAVFDLAIRDSSPTFLIGARPDEIDTAVARITTRWPGLEIAGHRHGYFVDDGERAEVIERIVRIQPGLVVVGMGAPLQERFLVDLRDAGWQGTGFTCGGFLHQLVDRLHYYPGWVDRLELRWLYRGITDPRVARRLVTTYPAFVGCFTRDAIRRDAG